MGEHINREIYIFNEQTKEYCLVKKIRTIKANKVSQRNFAKPIIIEFQCKELCDFMYKEWQKSMQLLKAIIKYSK